MCTLIAAFQEWPGVPLLVAANRDEALARPAVGPLLWDGPPRFVAPRDETAGGSWLGLNEEGLFVGITNRSGSPSEPGRRSRGLLVTDALRARSAVELRERLDAMDPHTYHSFHLFYADRGAAYLAVWDSVTFSHLRLERGVHLITERSPQADYTSRGALIRSLWDGDRMRPAPEPTSLIQLLSHHAAPPHEGICVHLDAFGYGTRSSAILCVGERLSDSRLWWAEGAPCRTPFEDRSGLLRFTGTGE